MVHVVLFPTINVLHCYISTFWSMCAVHNIWLFSVVPWCHAFRVCCLGCCCCCYFYYYCYCLIAILITGISVVIFRQTKLKIAFWTTNSLGNLLTHRRQAHDKFSLSGVYKLICPDCNKTYVRQTGRWFSKHYKEYKTAFHNNSNTSRKYWSSLEPCPPTLELTASSYPFKGTTHNFSVPKASRLQTKDSVHSIQHLR